MDQFERKNDCVNLGRTQRYAITFGEVAILHVGGEKIGNSRRSEGFSVTDLREIQKKFDKYGELVMISDVLPENLRKENEAAVLIIRNGANILLKDKWGKNKLFMEQQNQVVYDDKFWSSRQNRTMNKRARKNTTFGPEDVKHSEDYRVFTVNSFARLPCLNQIRLRLSEYLGVKAEGLNAEGNFYFEDKSGIGFHGDAERKIVICLSLGTTSTLRFCWRMPKTSKKYGNSIDIILEHGDIYIMSEKATGYDWKHSSKVRVVHAAGNSKYITHK